MLETSNANAVPLKQYTMTAKDVAEMLGFHIVWVRRLAATGKIPGVKRFREWLFNRDEITAKIEELTALSIAKSKATAKRAKNAKASR